VSAAESQSRHVAIAFAARSSARYRASSTLGEMDSDGTM
jgi:hypothetical protein